MKKYYSLIIAIIFLGKIFMSCDPLDIPSDYEIVSVEEDIKSDTQWEGNKVYVIKKNDFQVESTLTIDPGAIIKFTANAGNITVVNGAKIIALGTSGKPIIFTSVKDDNNGGDTNGDGGNTSPAKGDWSSIALIESSGSEFVNCKFMYGGKVEGQRQNAALDISSNSSAVVNNCTFAYNGGKYDKTRCYGALHAVNADIAKTGITNNTFYSNELPLTIHAEQDIDNSNSFSYGSETNKYNGIFVDGLSINKNTKWEEDEVAFVILASNLSVYPNVQLTVSNNVVLKFLDQATLSLENGESALINHDASGVYFTSFKDDAHGGDSNGNENIDSSVLSQEGYYDWNGIYTGGQKSSDYADWENILYNNPNPVAKKKV
jgi:hypothetical protein